jgi:hypothetical protein
LFEIFLSFLLFSRDFRILRRFLAFKEYEILKENPLRPFGPSLARRPTAIEPCDQLGPVAWARFAPASQPRRAEATPTATAVSAVRRLADRAKRGRAARGFHFGAAGPQTLTTGASGDGDGGAEVVLQRSGGATPCTRRLVARSGPTTTKRIERKQWKEDACFTIDRGWKKWQQWSFLMVENKERDGGGALIDEEGWVGLEGGGGEIRL